MTLALAAFVTRDTKKLGTQKSTFGLSAVSSHPDVDWGAGLNEGSLVGR